MKKKITFGTMENQGDDFLRYSRSLNFSQRLYYLDALRKRSYGNNYTSEKEKIELQKTVKKPVMIFSAHESESLSDFFKRLAQYKRDGHI